MKSQKSNHQQQSYLQLMSATESACENKERLSIDSNDASRPSIAASKKLSLKLASRESMEGAMAQAIEAPEDHQDPENESPDEPQK